MPNTVTEKTTTGTDHCHRCGGLMVPEQVFEIRSIDFRCVSCGERIDPVILAHRQRHLTRGESESFPLAKEKQHSPLDVQSPSATTFCELVAMTCGLDPQQEMSSLL